jgi:Cu2+-exporting ATPase
VPISLGVTLAAGMSLYQTVRGSEQVYFDAAISLLFFLLVGRYLDQQMRARAANTAANLLGLKVSCHRAGRGRHDRAPAGTVTWSPACAS